MDEGAIVPAQTMYDMSRDWYAGRMDVGWQPPTGQQASATFARHGLAGEFWELSSY